MARVAGETKDLVVLSLGFAFFFLYLELLKAERSSQWAGILPGDWLGLTAGGLAYGLVLFGLAVAGRAILARVQSGPAMLMPVAAAIVWGLLSVHREYTPTLDDGIVAAALVGAGAALGLGAWRGWWTARGFGVLLILTWLSGLAGLYAAGEYFLFHVDRARMVTVYPAAWLAFSGVLLLLLFRWRSSWVAPMGLVLVLAPVLCVAWLLRAPAAGEGERPPNLVFFIADTLRADYCSAYGGHVPTPNLERLAAQGTRFDRHYSLAPWTLPSMTGLFSSQYPKSLTPDAGHEAWTLQMNQYEVDYAEPTFPMRLEKAGYATGAITANAFLPVIPGMMFGYQERASSHPILLEDEGLFRQLPFLGALARNWIPPLANIRPHNTTRDLDHYARAFVERHRDRPFFLWIHYIDPHAPYDPPESLRRVHEGPWPFFHPYIGGEAWNIPILGKNFEVQPEDRDYVTALYEGEVAYIDGYTGRIMDVLESAGVAENTLFCFTSDHGEELWDHGEWGHGQSLFEEMVRVPLIIAGPGVEARVEPSPVSSIDLVPTLAELLAVDPSPSWRGSSLGAVLRGEGGVPPGRPVFAGGTSNKSPNPAHMIVVGDYKLIQTAGHPPQLYDLSKDPKELNDIAAQEPDRSADMLQQLEQWRASYPAYFSTDSGVPEFNRALEEGLEGMGYF